MTGNKELFPYDVSINLIRNADFTRIHTDVGYHGEEEYTCLVYLNPNWKRDYYGETTFFEKNSDNTDIVAQVKPKYGRLVIFDGMPMYFFNNFDIIYGGRVRNIQFLLCLLRNFLNLPLLDWPVLKNSVQSSEKKLSNVYFEL